MSADHKRVRVATGIANAGVIVSGTVIAAGIVLPPWWPIALNLHMGRPSPIDNFIRVVFGYPIPEPFLYGDMPLHEWVATSLPLVVQFITVVACTILLSRLLTAVAPDGAFGARSRRTLSILGIIGLSGGILLFGVGVLSWILGRSWLPPDPSAGPYQIAMVNQFPFPQWPLTFLLIGIVASALSVAFKTGARMEEDLEGVV